MHAVRDDDLVCLPGTPVLRQQFNQGTSLHIAIKDVTVTGQFICGSQLFHGKCCD